MDARYLLKLEESVTGWHFMLILPRDKESSKIIVSLDHSFSCHIKIEIEKNLKNTLCSKEHVVVVVSFFPHMF